LILALINNIEMTIINIVTIINGIVIFSKINPELRNVHEIKSTTKPFSF
jgi:hypothetical protein